MHVNIYADTTPDRAQTAVMSDIWNRRECHDSHMKLAQTHSLTGMHANIYADTTPDRRKLLRSQERHIVAWSTALMQEVSARCNTPQHAATRCNTLQHAATYCIPHSCKRSRRAATCCNTLQHAATRCNTLKHTPQQHE